MSQLLFELRAVIEHPPLSLADDQHEGILEETTFTVTALNSTEAKNKVFEEILKDQQRLIHLEITDKKETR